MDKYKISLIQNAETIKLVGSDGKPMPVTALKEGDEVLVYFESYLKTGNIPLNQV